MKENVISLNGDRMLINRCRALGLTLFNPQGEWNGYGYTRLPMAVRINCEEDRQKYEQAVEEVETKRKQKKPPKSEKEKKEAWAKRLSKLGGIGYEEALDIADEKLAAKMKQIDDLEDRQSRLGYSVRMEKLISKLWRSNPLRRIEDEDHAKRIIAASKRHRDTEYEGYLEEIHELEDYGLIQRGYAKEIARGLISRTLTYEDVEEQYGILI